MPRDGSGIYSLPNAAFVPSTTIASAVMNGDLADIVNDLNNPRPITAGGTGGNSVMAGFDNLVTAGVSVASASSINLDTATAALVDLTGNVAVTGVTLSAGHLRLVRATGTPLMTASAGLVVNRSTSQNYQCVAGDLLVFEGYAGSVVRMWVVGAVPLATAANYQANSGALPIGIDQIWAAMTEVTLTDATTIAWDMSTGMDFTVTLSANRTLGNPTNCIVGKRGRIRVVQDGTGSRTLTKSSNLKTVGGAAIALSTAAAAEDYLDYDCVSATKIRIAVSKAWS